MKIARVPCISRISFRVPVFTKSRLKNYCSQKNLRLIIHDSIKENHLGVKKLHLNRKGNSVFAKKFA